MPQKSQPVLHNLQHTNKNIQFAFSKNETWHNESNSVVFDYLCFSFKIIIAFNISVS